MKKIFLIVIAATLLLVVFVVTKDQPTPTPETPAAITPEPVVLDYKNTSYVINGERVTLKDGFSETEVMPGSASKITVSYFGNELRHDLNDDGREDVVFLLTEDGAGSGTFFYVVAALNTPEGYVGSEAFFLGDRIAPQSTNIDEGPTANGTNRQNVVVVNFATRAQGEPFSARPSVGASVWLKLDPATMQFAAVAQNFEGESL